MTTQEILHRAKAACLPLSRLKTEEKNTILYKMANAIEKNQNAILAENEKDVAAAMDTIGAVMIDRLRLTPQRCAAMADGIRALAALDDPIGTELARTVRADGLIIRRVRVPLGVVGIIYESRPNVTADAAALAFKSGNVCVLRAGKEAYATSHKIVEILREVLSEYGLADAVNMPTDPSRQSAVEMMEAVGLIDVLIPRGGAGLIRACVENAKVPCIETGTGICHVYVDGDADVEKALAILENAKTSRPSVCNAAEVCLVDRSIARSFLPLLLQRLTEDRTRRGLHAVELRCDAQSHAIIGQTPATDRDFDTEFLDYVLAVAVVDGVSGAIAHIAAHSTHHSDAIITENREHSDRFTASVDSAAVYVNASTRFTDGGEFGLGCEIGISTQKLHARGPMGLCELTTYRYIIEGDGHIRG